MYEDNGGHITEESNFGTDPLTGDPEKSTIRERALSEKLQQYFIIVNENDRLFQAGLKFRLSVSQLYYREDNPCNDCVIYCQILHTLELWREHDRC